jgi:hypothetical protein
MVATPGPSGASADLPAAIDTLALIETSSALADVLDQLKRDLETRGWSTTAAQQAAIVVFTPLIHASAGTHPGRS